MPPRPDPATLEQGRARQRCRPCRRWAGGFALAGLLIPIICLLLDFQPQALRSLCELLWPTGFLLLGGDGGYQPALLLAALGSNALLWAGVGWLLGYARS